MMIFMVTAMSFQTIYSIDYGKIKRTSKSTKVCDISIATNIAQVQA